MRLSDMFVFVTLYMLVNYVAGKDREYRENSFDQNIRECLPKTR